MSGKTTEGKYVPFAGSYGKYLIDNDNNVTSVGEFSMSLSELKKKIVEALKLPYKKHIPTPLQDQI